MAYLNTGSKISAINIRFLTFYFLFFTISTAVRSQGVGINTNTPHASAMLDIRSSTKGLLIPRTSTATRMAIVNPAKGLLVFDTTAMSSWFYTGSEWIAHSDTKNTWTLSGNTNTTDNHFIGTTDARPILFKVKNISSGIIDSASGNTALGYYTHPVVTTGTYNTSYGAKAHNYLRSGINNTAIGFSAGMTTAIGNNNTAVGVAALYSNYDGNHNTAVGVNAASSNHAAVNTAVGSHAFNRNLVGIYNTSVGGYALALGYSGSSNTAIGSYALAENGGNDNTALGMYALVYNDIGNSNVAVGYESGPSFNHTNLNNSISIGNRYWPNGLSNQVLVGNQFTTNVASYAPWTSVSDERVKNNITDDVKGLDFILRLRPVTYYASVKAMLEVSGNKMTTEFPDMYDVEKIKQTGFLAQQVEQAAKESGFEFNGVKKIQSTKEMYGLSYSLFVVPLVKAMQEQQQIIEDLKKRIEQLERSTH